MLTTRPNHIELALDYMHTRGYRYVVAFVRTVTHLLRELSALGIRESPASSTLSPEMPAQDFDPFRRFAPDGLVGHAAHEGVVLLKARIPGLARVANLDR